MKEETYYCVEPEYSYVKSYKCSTMLFPSLDSAYDFLKKCFDEFPSQDGFVIRKVVVMI